MNLSGTNAEADKFCLLKLPDIKPQDLNLWSDHLGAASAASLIRKGMEEVTKLDNESIQKQFESDTYKISLDMAFPCLPGRIAEVWPFQTDGEGLPSSC